jgi:hypothetical protein
MGYNPTLSKGNQTESQTELPQPQGVADDRNRTQAHRGTRNDPAGKDNMGGRQV